MSKRGQQRIQKLAEAKKNQRKKMLLVSLKMEYRALINQVMDGYKERINRYLKNLSPEMKQQIGYSQVGLSLETKWEVPSEELITKYKEARKIDLDPKEKVFHISLIRENIHTKVVSTSIVWGTVVSKIDSEDNTEIIAYCSLLGNLSESGVEYKEAQRVQQQEEMNRLIQQQKEELDTMVKNQKAQKRATKKTSETKANDIKPTKKAPDKQAAKGEAVVSK